MKNISIPKIKSLGDNNFIDCAQLESISLGFTWSGDIIHSINGCSKVEYIDISGSPDLITKSFNGLSALKEFYISCEVPPAVDADIDEWDEENYSFNDLKPEAVLYVPQGCREAYTSAKGWNKFNNIEERY